MEPEWLCWDKICNWLGGTNSVLLFLSLVSVIEIWGAEL